MSDDELLVWLKEKWEKWCGPIQYNPELESIAAGIDINEAVIDVLSLYSGMDRETAKIQYKWRREYSAWKSETIRLKNPPPFVLQ